MKKFKLMAFTLAMTIVLETPVFASTSGVKQDGTSDNNASLTISGDKAEATTDMKVGTYKWNPTGGGGTGEWELDNSISTTISAEVPLKMVCAIQPNESDYSKAFVSPKFTIKNTSNAPIDVIASMKEKTGTNLKMVGEGTYTEKQWQTLGINDSKSKIALGMKETKSGGKGKWFSSSGDTFALDRLNSVFDTDNNSREYTIQALHGMSFSGGLSVSYDLVYTISLAN